MSYLKNIYDIRYYLAMIISIIDKPIIILTNHPTVRF